jgi:hypothetical protein
MNHVRLREFQLQLKINELALSQLLLNIVWHALDPRFTGLMRGRLKHLALTGIISNISQVAT